MKAAFLVEPGRILQGHGRFSPFQEMGQFIEPDQEVMHRNDVYPLFIRGKLIKGEGSSTGHWVEYGKSPCLHWIKPDSRG